MAPVPARKLMSAQATEGGMKTARAAHQEQRERTGHRIKKEKTRRGTLRQKKNVGVEEKDGSAELGKGEGGEKDIRSKKSEKKIGQKGG